MAPVMSLFVSVCVCCAHLSQKFVEVAACAVIVNSDPVSDTQAAPSVGACASLLGAAAQRANEESVVTRRRINDPRIERAVAGRKCTATGTGSSTCTEVGKISENRFSTEKPLDVKSA
jgi:hypothetical protein